MTSTTWQSWQILSSLCQTLQEILATASSSGQVSSVWVGSSGSSWISDITIQETNTNVMLCIQMPETLTDLEIKVSPETVVIQGKPIDSKIEGFFCTSFVQNLIPLPIAVHPESVQARLENDVLMLVLPKSGQLHRQSIAVQFSSEDLDLTQDNVLNTKCRCEQSSYSRSD